MTDTQHADGVDKLSAPHVPASSLGADEPALDHKSRDYKATAGARLATRLAFFVAGFLMASCAPLFPFFKENVSADKAAFGALLLCLGVGSLIAMPITGGIAARRGAGPLVLLGGFSLVILLPILALASSAWQLGMGLFFFGAALGMIDVGMNVHASQIEGMEQRPLMSNFHAHWSIGGFVGAGAITLLLSFSVPVVICAVVGAVVAFVLMLVVWPRLLPVIASDGPESFVMPRGIVLLLAALASITFLVEGAVLDWGALLIIDRQLTVAENGGIGYILFSIAMLIARLTGDRVVARIGALMTLVFGGGLAMLGLVVVATAPFVFLALSGFILIGLGAANLVPVLFSAAGRQKIMPPGMAIAAITTTGYAGILLGPAMIGWISDTTSLVTAFVLLALLMLSLPLSARWVARL